MSAERTTAAKTAKSKTIALIMNRCQPPIPVVLLTGFLGAGKTTLLTKWLQQAASAGLRVGVLMNEFGTVSIDSALAATPGVPMEQVSSGCLCCAEDGKLADSLQRLLTERACDLIIIETSGLAEPCSIIGILTEPEILPLVQLHAVFTVVDAQNYELHGLSDEERGLADRQIAYASVLFISKCDCVTDDELNSVRRGIQAINSSARLICLPKATLNIAEIFYSPPSSHHVEVDDAQTILVEGAAEDHLHASYRTLTVNLSAAVRRADFEDFLRGLDRREVVRTKGFVRFRHETSKLYSFHSILGFHLIQEFFGNSKIEPVVVMIGPDINLPKYAAYLRAMQQRDTSVPSFLIKKN
ncbi:MAG: hypothetical protein JWM68_3341 [Verrucomicrobiales bacterium]|nr:hypothetical protein [Verrucomicrobiales bacterium]